MYFPEAEGYYTNSRAQWLTQQLHRFLCPAATTCYSPDAFEQKAWTGVGRKVNKRGFPRRPLCHGLSQYRARCGGRFRGHPDVPCDVGGTSAPVRHPGRD
ncbi:MAG: hypothetical protein LZF60_420010 [Nitrospira sp.]|nr:MAG: hypothetical protein LZF60_420010 [Nitrospira sp.]